MALSSWRPGQAHEDMPRLLCHNGAPDVSSLPGSRRSLARLVRRDITALVRDAVTHEGCESGTAAPHGWLGVRGDRLRPGAARWAGSRHAWLVVRTYRPQAQHIGCTSVAPCITLCRASNLTEALRLSSPFASQSRGKRRASSRPPRARVHPHRPSTNCEKWSEPV